MRSKTSCFNKTIYKKNLTRFAPVWGVYTLCLVAGVLILYRNGGTVKQFHFANNLTQLPEILSVVNLVYALVTAQLLFGDLYNSRNCNMLHSLPLRRETWFVTHVASGLTFSLVPTAVMALTAAPLLLGSIFENAVSLSGWLFLSANLQYICFFGMAVFAAMCVGNRFTMVAGYGLLNAGAMMAYWLVDTVYTPMLYGVITPTTLMYNMTTLNHMVNYPYITSKANLYDLREEFGNTLEGATASFTISGEWWRLWMLAGVGLAFLVLALLLYRKRDLECAGDAVAFPFLVPVFQVLCAIFVATAASYLMENFLGMNQLSYLLLCAGLVVGWFVSKMLVERSTRVFRLKNFYGLAVLAVVFGASLLLTELDVLGIQTKLPEADKVEKVFFESDWTAGRYLEKTADIEAMLALQADALENPAENSGTYVTGLDGGWVQWIDENEGTYADDGRYGDCTYVAQIGLTYEMKGGKIIKRRYNVWVDSEAGAIARDYLSDWEELDWRMVELDGREVSRLELVLESFESFSVDGVDFEKMPELCKDKAAAQSLLAAIRSDCTAGDMAQHPFFHDGYFRYENERSETGYSDTESIGISFSGERYGWYVTVYADAGNTLRWLKTNGLLETYEIRQERLRLW